jgi:hypothetical protein
VIVFTGSSRLDVDPPQAGWVWAVRRQTLTSITKHVFSASQLVEPSATHPASEPPAYGTFRHLEIRREHLGQAGKRQERPSLGEGLQHGGLARHIFRMRVLAELRVLKGLPGNQSEAGEKLGVSGYRQRLKAVAQKPEILGWEGSFRFCPRIC